MSGRNNTLPVQSHLAPHGERRLYLFSFDALMDVVDQLLDITVTGFAAPADKDSAPLRPARSRHHDLSEVLLPGNLKVVLFRAGLEERVWVLLTRCFSWPAGSSHFCVVVLYTSPFVPSG